MAKTIPAVPAAAILAVQDPNTRSALRALADYLAVRNGDTGDGQEAFLTLADLTQPGATVNAVAGALAIPMAGGVNKPGTPLDQLAQQLENRIIASAAWQSLFSCIDLIAAPDSVPGSVSWQLLQEARARGAAITTVSEKLQNTAVSLAKTITTLTAALADNAAAITRESQVRADSDTAMARSNSAMVVSTAQNTAAIQGETSVRTNSDNALAAALNSIWARVGNNTALVQSGTQIAVNDVGAAMSKFDQLQAIVTNPGSGLVDKSVALRQEMSATASAVSGMQAKWGIKLDVNGNVSGVTLMSGATTGGKAESSFVVAADIFAIGAPGVPGVVPFAFDARSGLLALKGSMIAKGSVEAAHMATGTITAASGVIGDAAVTTLNIRGNAVTVPKIASRSDDITTGWNPTDILSTTITLDQAGTILAVVTCSQGSRSGPHGWEMWLLIDGQKVAFAGGSSAQDAVALSGGLHVGPGIHSIVLMRQSTWEIWAYDRTMTIFGAMR
jgi:hypothetical protein